MADHQPLPPEASEPTRPVPTISDVLPDGSIVETLYDADAGRTVFAIGHGGTWREEASLMTGGGQRLVPYAPTNNLLKHNVVLLPSRPEEYGSAADLVAEIREFIHRYVDLSPLYEEIAAYYVLLTWVYDRFNELPYLRVRGDFGSGKSRFLLTVGSLCYKPIFASGASTVSPLFRLLDTFRGTLVIDESDFRMSDEKAEVVKILNNGNGRGFPVLRSEANGRGEFNPRAYHVFGPKLVATRGFFTDRALESRCLTEELGQRRLRDDIPITLPETHAAEALRLRNKLLLFRLRNFSACAVRDDLVDPTIEPRLNQIFVPLMSIVDDEATRERLRDLARRYAEDAVADRGMDTEAQVLEVIADLLAVDDGPRLTIKEITEAFIERFGEEYDRKVTNRWIGSVLRKKLGLVAHKSDGTFAIALTAKTRATLDRVAGRYGVSMPLPDDSAGAPAPAPEGDLDVVRF
jgi:hypothetical protein